MIDWCDWSCELAKWQTLIAGVVGIGVALFAYWLGRKRDRALREDEAKAVAAALYGEFIAIAYDLHFAANMAINALDKGKSFRPDQLDLFIPVPTVIRDSVSHRSGLLPPHLFNGLSQFYQRIERVRRSIALAKRSGSLVSHQIVADACIRSLEIGERVRPEFEAYIGFSDEKHFEASALREKLSAFEKRKAEQAAE